MKQSSVRANLAFKRGKQNHFSHHSLTHIGDGIAWQWNGMDNRWGNAESFFVVTIIPLSSVLCCALLFCVYMLIFWHAISFLVAPLFAIKMVLFSFLLCAGWAVCLTQPKNSLTPLFALCQQYGWLLKVFSISMLRNCFHCIVR